jgi:K+/H+ antiporter YhaU regulatory subunit KhtT
MQIELTNEEINFIQQVLGELPTKTGAFLVMNNIAKQVHEQTPQTLPAPQE